jgi:ribonuclease E
MLINATQEEELRMAMVDGQRLFDLNIEGPASERKKANIYKGKITRIEPSLEAAFVDYGADRHGFLPLKEISSEYFVKEVASGSKPNIKEVLKEGQDIVVQIDKEERGNKGAALTTYVSLAGRFIVLKPNKDHSGGVSRRIVGGDRDLARKSLTAIEVPDGMSVILRTAGIDRSAEELAWDLENLLAVWHAILNVVLERPSPFLIYRESNAVVRALRDYLTNEIGEILIDSEATYKEASEFVEQVMPHNLRKLKLYSDPVPLFTRFQIESQIESAFAHNVTLPSGGSIVIDHTEALVSIDINSARATKGSDIEATALNTNLEAADEIARQLRIRDLGGLIVIDFIDMGPQKNQRAVENRLREAVRQDRARVQIGKITRFGLLEMSRQRLRPSLGESSYHTCPRCSGFGTIRSVESLALAILRIVGEEARKERTTKVIAQLPVEVATYLLNEKRDWVRSVETRHDTQVVLVANSALETPHYDIRRVRDDQADLPENAGVSYSLAEAEPEPDVPASMQERQVAEQAAIGKIEPASPAPARKSVSGPGFWARLMSLFTGDKKKPAKKKSTKARRRKSSSGGERKKPQRGRRSDARKDDTRRPRKKQSKKKTTGKKTTKADAKRSADKSESKKDQQVDDTRKEESKDDSRRPSRNRRSRGGRRRRRSADRPAADAKAQVDATVDTQPDTTQQEQSPAPEKEARKPRQPRRKPTAEKPAAGAEQPPAEGAPKVRTDAERAADKVAKDVGAQAESKAPPQPATEAKPKAKRKPKSDSKPEPKAEAQPKAESRPEPVAGKEPKTESRPEAATETKSKSDSKPKTRRKPKSEAPATKAEKSPVESSSKSESGNGSSGEATADKPASRLLPWEPVHPPVEVKPEKIAGPVKTPPEKTPPEKTPGE